MGGPMRLCWERSCSGTHSSLPCMKIKTNKNAGLLRLFVNVLTSYVIDIMIFSILCQNVATHQRNKLALYQTQNGGPN